MGITPLGNAVLGDNSRSGFSVSSTDGRVIKCENVTVGAIYANSVKACFSLKTAG